MAKITALSNKNEEILTDLEKSELIAQKHNLEDIYKQMAKGAFIRSRRNWIEEGEQNSAYFFRLERQRVKSSIQQLYIDRNVTDDHKIIADYCAKFYSDLYSSKFCHQSATNFFNSLSHIKQINKEDCSLCDAPISLSEITESINNLKINKSPGVDGLSAELYKVFKQKLAPFLHKMFLESIEKTTLPPSLCQGLITLIPKPNKDHLLIENWCPICLLNSDYKMIALILAKRLKLILNDIIDECQSGFIQQRHISNNIRLILDILDYSDLIPTDSFILFLDYYKAFDCLEHKFMLQALERIGFGNFFCKCVKMLYCNGNSSIQLNNGTSPRFSLNRGIRQGISPYLFLIATQFLNLYIKESPLKGISVAGTELIISQ